MARTIKGTDKDAIKRARKQEKQIRQIRRELSRAQGR